MTEKPLMTEQPWYHKGLRFRCTGCGDCCTGAPGHVWVNKAEIEAIAASLGVELEQFEKRYVRLVGIRKSLVEFPGGDCVFFDNQSRGCKIYDVRPRQCRTWPFWPSNLRTPEAWKEMCGECPGADKGPCYSLKRIRADMAVMHV